MSVDQVLDVAWPVLGALGLAAAVWRRVNRRIDRPRRRKPPADRVELAPDPPRR